jgi:hypothetical protein
MSASERQWQRLERLEGHQQRVHSKNDSARHGIERATPREAEELRRAWRGYCEVIAELEEPSAEFDVRRTSPD